MLFFGYVGLVIVFVDVVYFLFDNLKFVGGGVVYLFEIFLLIRDLLRFCKILFRFLSLFMSLFVDGLIFDGEFFWISF